MAGPIVAQPARRSASEAPLFTNFRGVTAPPVPPTPRVSPTSQVKPTAATRTIEHLSDTPCRCYNTGIMYAELVINIEAALSSTFHYAVPADLAAGLRVGHLVEVEFGTRLAQGIVVSLDEESPVEDVKPIISVIDDEPVVQPYQVALARRLSAAYLTSLNACLRLMLPPGLTRWSDITLAIHPRFARGQWRDERLTEAQSALLTLLAAEGDRRGRQISRALGAKSNWRNAADQLERRGLLVRGSVLDPPRVRPKKVRTAELIGSPRQLRRSPAAAGPGEQGSRPASLLSSTSADPLLALDEVLAATGAKREHAAQLAADGLVQLIPAQEIAVAGEVAAATDEERALLTRLPAAGRHATGRSPDPHGRSRAGGPQRGAGNHDPDRDAGRRPGRRLRKAPGHALPRGRARPGAGSPAACRWATSTAKPSCNLNHLRRLVKLDVIRLGSEEVWRDPLADRDFVPADPPRLTRDQARVWGRLKLTLLGVDAEDPAREHKAAGRFAARRHRQRQDGNLHARHRVGAGAGPAGHRAGAGNRPDAADRTPLCRPLSRPRGRAAQPAQRRRALRHLAPGAQRPVRHRRRAAQRAVCPAARPRRHRARRGARRQLQADAAGAAALLPHPRCGRRRWAQITGRGRHPGQRHAGHRDLPPGAGRRATSCWSCRAA